MLEYVPEHWKVVKHVRPKYSCSGCQKIVQANAPSRPITCRTTDKARSTRETVSSLIARLSPIGEERPARYLIRCSGH